MAGARYDRIDLRSRQPVDKLLLPSASHFCLDASCVEEHADDEVGGLSWTLSVSYALPLGLVPYVHGVAPVDRDRGAGSRDYGGQHRRRPRVRPVEPAGGGGQGQPLRGCPLLRCGRLRAATHGTTRPRTSSPTRRPGPRGWRRSSDASPATVCS